MRGLEGSEVHLWYCLLDAIPDPALPWRYHALLADDERQRLAAFRFEEDRRQYLMAHALLRTTLSQYAPVPPEAWRFERTAQGKPHAPQAPWLQFNLTHTRGLVACALAVQPVGVDAEWLGQPLDPALARFVLTPDERLAWEALPEQSRGRALLRCWTLKEAYVKARGLGLSLGFDRVFPRLLPRRARGRGPLERTAPGRGWYGLCLDGVSRRHLIAVVARGVPRLSTRESIPGEWVEPRGYPPSTDLYLLLED
jgi:4'-phosphopantetheinyl transferase